MNYKYLVFDFNNISGVLNFIKLFIHLILTIIITTKLYKVSYTKKEKASTIILTLLISLSVCGIIIELPIWIYLPIIIIGIFFVWVDASGAGGIHHSSDSQGNCGGCSYIGQCSGNPCPFYSSDSCGDS